MSDIVHIYVAGPYSQGDPLANTLRALKVADELFGLGAYPYVPHLSHYWHQNYPRSYEDWMDLDFAWLKKCDLLYRMYGHSPGAEREVELAFEHNIPVFLENPQGTAWAELVDYLKNLNLPRRKVVPVDISY